MLPRPAEIRASRGRTARSRPGCWWAEPWWATLRTSTGGSAGWARNSPRWAGGSRSPRSSRVGPPSTRTNSVTLASLGPSGTGPEPRPEPEPGTEPGPEPEPGPRAVRGHRTCQASGPTRRRSPGPARITATPATVAVLRTNSLWSRGSSNVVVCTAPTALPLNTPGSPRTWSAWKCVRRTSGTRVTPSSRRHRSASSGSGPASTTTAAPAPAASTVASPCPTSHIANVQPGGGQPVITLVSGAGRSTASRSSSAQRAAAQGCRGSRRARSTTRAVTAASSRPPRQPPGQPASAPGSAAPVRATEAIHPAGHPAQRASSSATVMATGAAARAANPRTVAGATASSATRLQGIATRLTLAAKIATTGAHTACAAAAAASASASRGGTRLRCSAALQRGPMVSRAPVARTESRKP